MPYICLKTNRGQGVTSTDAYERPRWLKDFVRFLSIKSQFVLSGNVRDLQLTEIVSGTIMSQPLVAAISSNFVALAMPEPSTTIHLMDSAPLAAARNAGPTIIVEAGPHPRIRGQRHPPA